eukprot:symbB.v1.2.010816.t1/scaffold706.1/size171012/5
MEQIKSEKQKQLALELEESHLEPYLPLNGVIRGLFHLIQQLFGVRWEKATKRREVPLWHRSIRFYRLVDIDSQFPIGGLYLDLFQHGKKLGSPEVFWNNYEYATFFAASFRWLPPFWPQDSLQNQAGQDRLLVHPYDFIWQCIVTDSQSRSKSFRRFQGCLGTIWCSYACGM